MTWLRIAAARLIEQMRRRRVTRDLDDELQAHVDLAIADHLRRGMPAAEARRQALAALGGLDQVREAVGDRRGIRSIGDLMVMIRLAARQLRKAPGVTLAAVVTLALTIGANTAIFSLVDSALLKPLPYADPDRLVSVWELQPRDGAPQRLVVSPADYRDFRRATGAAAMGGYMATAMTLTGRGDAVRLGGESVTASYFDVLGVPPRLGRVLQAPDEIAGRDRVVVISHGLWRERFGGGEDALGAAMVLNDQTYEVVGVMPAAFQGAASYRQQVPTDVWIPATFPADMLVNRSEHVMHVVARLAAGRSADALADELRAIAAGFETAATGRQIDIGVASFQADAARDVRPLLLFLLAAVALVLLLGCVNVAGLLIVQSLARRREIAVRFALGATRRRVAIELLIPSVLLATMGAAAGWALALILKGTLVQLAPTAIPRLDAVALDARVLAFTSLVAGGAAILFSVLPAWPLIRTRPIEALASTSRLVAHSWALRSRRMLVAIEVAISVLLMVGAGLMMRSLAALNDTDLGFRTDNVLTTTISLPSARYRTPADRLTFFDTLSSRVERLPGVQSVAFANRLPLRGAWTSGLLIEGTAPAPEAPGMSAGFQSVSPGYFRTVGVPLRRGRLFDARDRDGTMPVAVVNESFVTALLGGGEPIGRQFRRFAQAPAVTIVGVVGDIRRHGPRVAAEPEVYLPALQTSLYPLALSEFAIRVDADPSAFAPALRAAILTIDDRQPPGAMRTLEETFARGQAEPRFQVFLLTMFAALALTLAVVGIYGVVAYAVTQRTPEIGLRVALGANRRAVLRWLLLQTLRPSLIGATAGVVAALLLARGLRGFLYEISPSDPVTYGAAAGILAIAATVASLLAARRALAVDPISVLR